jgi:putative Mg2+ transporter-C (MgtC) family protein
VGLAVGAGYFEAALISTAMILLVELVLSRFEWFLMSTSRDIHLYVEYKENDALERIDEYLRTRGILVSDLHITKSAGSSKTPCAIYSLQLPRKMTHDRVMTALTEIQGVVSVEEL